jgi:uncharacterized protein
MTQPAPDYQKPIPVPDEASRPFFEGAREHVLMLQKCAECGTFMWPVKARCTHCMGADLSWLPASGKGTLYSFVLMHQVFHPGFAAEAPYNIAEIDLEEGIRIISNVIGIPNEELKIGMQLAVTFEDISDEVALPRFLPAHWRKD